jgi:hypothetical protein
MFLNQNLDFLTKYTAEAFQSLSEYLSPDLLTQCLEKQGIATIRKRRLPAEMVVWVVVGMALFRHIPMNQIVNQLDIGRVYNSSPTATCRGLSAASRRWSN